MTVTWEPPARPRWVQRFNDHRTHTRGTASVSLDPGDLEATARAATGLDDFGDDDGWRANYHVFTSALARECPLHLLGATMTRTDIVAALENRLELTDLWRRRPEILEAEVPSPIFIVGAARSGTSILHELLALDRTHIVPTTWRVHRPVIAATGDLHDQRAARHSVDAVVQFWHDVQPEYEAMHHNGGELPTECIFLTVPMFLSDNWGGTHTTPTYEIHLATTDHTPAYEWHRRMLQTIQTTATGQRWVLKAPSHLATLRALFSVYPDARIIQLHRDPARTLPSMFDLMGTLKWMRTDAVDLESFVVPATAGIAHLQRRAIEDRGAGVLPDDRFHDMRYADFMADPVAAISAAYHRFGLTVTDEFVRAITDYLAAKPRGSKGTHRYDLADFGLTAADIHRQYADYLDRFSISPEA